MKIPQDFLREIGIIARDDAAANEGYGKNVYEIILSVNMPAIITNGISYIKVIAYIGNPQISLSINTNNLTTRNFNAAIKTTATTIRKLARKRAVSTVGNTSIDLTNLIDNSAIELLNTLPASSKRASDALTTRNVFELSSIEKSGFRKLNSKNIVGTSMATVHPRTSEINTEAFQESCLRVLMSGVDPASLFQYPFPIIPAEFRLLRKSSRGPTSSLEAFEIFGQPVVTDVIRPVPSRDIDVDNGFFTKLIRREARLSGPYNDSQDLIMSTITFNPGASSTVTRTKKNLIYQAVRRPFYFKFSSAQATPTNIFFKFLAVNKDGVIVDKRIKSVNLPDINTVNTQPLLPPIIKVSNTSVRGNYITLSQQDPRATGIRIYKKVVDLSTIRDNQTAGFSEIVKVGCLIPDRSFYNDMSDPTKITIYRAVAVDKKGNMSEEFASAAMAPVKTTGNNETIRETQDLKNTKRGVTIPRVEEERIVVEVPNVPRDVVSVTVQARDVTGVITNGISQIYDTGTLINLHGSGEVQRALGGGKKTLTFVHDNPVDEKTYEYKVCYQNKDGTQSDPPERSYSEYRAKKTTGVDFSVKTLKTEDKGATSAVSFDIAADFTTQGMQEVTQLVAANDALSSFKEDITNNRGRFQELLKSSVKRLNVKTGEIVDFGVQDLTTFVDDPSSNTTQNSPPVVAGGEYRYEVTLLKAPLSHLLLDVKEEVKDPDRLLKYIRDEARFDDPIYKRKGVLPSRNTDLVKDNRGAATPASVFLNGATTLVKFVNVSFPMSKASVSNLVVEMEGIDNRIRLGWKVTGNRATIDHIQVLANFQGVSAVIGVAHCFQQGSNFSFLDSKLSGLVGLRKYGLRVIYNDY